jgi:hypothetical protein
VTGERVGEATVGVTAFSAVVGVASNVACVVLDAGVAESVGSVAPATELGVSALGATVDTVPRTVEEVTGDSSEAEVGAAVVVVCAEALLVIPNTAIPEIAPAATMDFRSLPVVFACCARSK